MQPPPGKKYSRAKAKADGWTDEEIDAYLAQFDPPTGAQVRSEDQIVMEALGLRRDKPDDEEEPYGVLPNLVEGAEQFARGAGLGATQALTSAGRGLGYFVGSRGTEDYFKEREQAAERFFNPQGQAGQAGRFVGRLAGEVGTAVYGGGAIGKGAALAGRGLRALRGIQTAAAPVSGARRAAQIVAANAPIDVLQGLGQEEGGLVIPGRGGAAVENVLLSALGSPLAVRGERLGIENAIASDPTMLRQFKRMKAKGEYPNPLTYQEAVTLQERLRKFKDRAQAAQRRRTALEEARAADDETAMQYLAERIGPRALRETPLAEEELMALMQESRRMARSSRAAKPAKPAKP